MLQFGILLLFFTGGFSQVLDFGRCPKVEVIQDFNVSRYMRLWYENAKSFAIFEFGGKCITSNLSLNSDGTIHLKNSLTNIFTGMPSSVEGTLTLSENKTIGKLSLVYDSMRRGSPLPYLILGTDYDNYAVVYACHDFGLFHIKIVWIMTCKREPPSSAIDQAKKIIEKNDLSRVRLEITDQKNCP